MADEASFADQVHQQRQRMVQLLALDMEGQSPLSDPWRRALLRAPRHLFVGPALRDGDVYRRRDRGGYWLQLAYDDRQVEWLARMLEELDVEDEHRVLLVGADIGYTCAVLCERLTSRQVTMVDSRPRVLARARDKLAEAGYAPAAALRRYVEGHPPNAPYDRILIDRRLSDLDIPSTLIDQLGPGGRMVGMLSDGAVFLVQKNEQGQAEGGFPLYGWAAPDFMPRVRSTRGRRSTAPGPYHGERSTALAPSLCTLGWSPKLHMRLTLGEIGSDTVGWSGGVSSTTFEHRDGSWATVSTFGWIDGQRERGSAWTASEGGSRRLWTEIESTVGQWRALGSPDLPDYRLTVTVEQTVVRVTGTDGSFTWSFPQRRSRRAPSRGANARPEIGA